MFNWTTTTLVNKLPNCEVFKDTNDNPVGKVRIGKYLFEKRWVEKIRKAKGHSHELCAMDLDLAAVAAAVAAKEATKGATVARLYLYVGLEGSEESIYANDWYRKGMPLSVSFVLDADAAVMANAIANTVKQFNVFTKVKKVLDVTAEGSVLHIVGTHEHQRLDKLQVLVEVGAGEEIAVVNFEPRRTEQPAAVTKYVRGVNGFGTYSQLLKDLRLPTANHNHWMSVQKDEMPILGAIYHQYIITYYAPSSANPSFTAIGNRSMSETTHVFWVHEDLVSDWEKVLESIDPDGGNLETIPGKVDGNFSNESLVE